MSVNDGELANENTFNSSFVSREVDDNKAAKLTLDDPDTAESGTALTNTQRELNSQASFSGQAVNLAKDAKPTWASDAIGNPNDDQKVRQEAVQAEVETNQIDIAENVSDIDDIRTTTGTADGDTDMGTYAGALINDNESTKENIQQVETQVETNQSDIGDNASDIADLRTTTGTSDGDTDMGAYTGTVLTDNQNTKQNLQEIADAVDILKNALDPQGGWNANTNTPTLVSSTGTEGHFYIVTVAGTTNLDGETGWQAGDWAVFLGGVWLRSINNNIVHTGEVTGASALTVDPTAITNKSTVAPASGDFFLYSDTSDSGALKKVDFDDIGGGANKQLSNLVGPVAFNEDLIPDGNGVQSIGSLTKKMLFVFALISRYIDGTGATVGDVNAAAVLPSGVTAFALFASNNLKNVGMATSDTGAVGLPSGSSYEETGNHTAVTGGQKSGDINKTTGDSADGDSGSYNFVIGTAVGTQGEFKFLKSGVPPTPGDLWTATNADGSGYYASPPSGVVVDGDQNILAVQVFS